MLRYSLVVRFRHAVAAVNAEGINCYYSQRMCPKPDRFTNFFRVPTSTGKQGKIIEIFFQSGNLKKFPENQRILDQSGKNYTRKLKNIFSMLSIKIA